MTKPAIFFSHSSQDQKELFKLKKFFVEKTGASIDVFLSSDGQSIPLGRNWVHQIEKALEQASLMIVFVSPASLRSNWLFFESGFAYSKGIRVVPVGFRGVDLGALTPPLSLLQGFNITSEAGLNNIIAIANEVFGHSHSETFTGEEFDQVSDPNIFQSSQTFGDYAHTVDGLNITLSKTTGLSCPVPEALDRIALFLEEKATECQRSSTRLNIFGVSFTSAVGSLHIAIDPFLADLTLSVVEGAIPRVRDAGLVGVQIPFRFVDRVVCLEGRHRITGRMYAAGVSLADRDWLIYRDLRFQVEHKRYYTSDGSKRGPAILTLELLSNAIPRDQIKELLSHLFERQVLSLEF